jgi:hypothetical protein
MGNEVEEIRRRYLRRDSRPTGLYDFQNPDSYMCPQEKERALICWIREA